MARNGVFIKMSRNYHRKSMNKRTVALMPYSVAISGEIETLPKCNSLLDAVHECVAAGMCGKQIAEDLDALGIETSKKVQNYLLAHWLA